MLGTSAACKECQPIATEVIAPVSASGISEVVGAPEPTLLGKGEVAKCLRRWLTSYRDQRLLVIHDRAEPHRSPPVEAAVREAGGRLMLEVQPAYSPDLNPQERIWKWLRRVVTHNHRCESRDEQIEAIRDFFRYIAGLKNQVRRLVVPEAVREGKTMKKAMMVLVMCSLFWFSGLNTASAILLVDSGPPPVPGTGALIHATQFLAQEFSLSTGATITEIEPFLWRIGTGPDPVVTVQVTNAIGPGTQPSAVLFETSITVSNPFTNPAFLPISASFFLEAGTYFLVLSTNAEFVNSAAWGEDAPTDIGPDFFALDFGANSAFPPASNFMGGTLDFGLRIRGNPIPVNLATVLGNSGFEDDLVHSQWTATKPNNNYRLDAPVVNPVIIPKGETIPLQAPAGQNFIGILNSGDNDINGKLVHQVVTGSFAPGTVFAVTVFANRGRLQGASTPVFDSSPSELRVQFFGWGGGNVPTINPNTDNWSRRPSVNMRQSFISWAANGEWASQTFQFVTDKDLQYISLAIAGINHKNASYVAFDIGEGAFFLSLVEGDPGIPGDGIVVSAVGGRLDISFEVQPPFPLAGITNGITISAFPPSTAPESRGIQVNFSTAGGECAPGVASGEDVARPIVNGVQGIAIVFSQEDLNDLVDFVRQVEPQCADVTLDEFFLKEVILVDVNSNFVRELDALAVGIGENVFPAR